MNPVGGFRVRAVVVLIGFTAAIAQIVLLRELMVVFYGNEISIGLMLASWLFWTAAGSAGAGPLVRRVEPRRMVAALEVVLAVALPGTVLAVRASRGMLASVSGESLGPGAMLLTSLVGLSVLCAASGALFAAVTKLYAERGVDAAGTVYLFEAIGSAAGGVLAGLVLIARLNSIEIAFLLGMMNLAAAATLVKRVGLAVPLGVIGLVAVAPLETRSLAHFWRGFHVVAARNSDYGNLAVVETPENRSVYENGAALFHVPDRAAAEEAVHYALLEHPWPRSLLLIGGGVNGAVAEALKHRGLERIDYVELDPAILDIARRYFPGEWQPVEGDARVHVHATDGRLFLKTTPLRFDVVIVDAPDPQTAQLNRFYTVEFFREAADKLAEGGLVSFQLTASENYISPELAAFLRSINKTLRTVFPEVAAIPGDTVHFFAARRPGVLAADGNELLTRLRARRIDTAYVREYYIPFRMMPDRMADLEAQIQPTGDTPVNRDFTPVAYYFDVALWSGRFHHGYREFFSALAAVRFSVLAGVVAMLLVAACVVVRRPRTIAACSTAAAGFTMIGCEMLILLAFQAMYGYVYRQLALVIGAFMAGMALGSGLALRWPGARGLRALAAVQALVAVSPLVLCGLFEVLPRGAGAGLLFPALALGSGLLGGFEFPVASRVFSGSATGALYALDLAGSCAAAVLFSAWLIPVFGFLGAAVITGFIAIAPAAIAMTFSPKPHCTLER